MMYEICGDRVVIYDDNKNILMLSKTSDPCIWEYILRYHAQEVDNDSDYDIAMRESYY